MKKVLIVCCLAALLSGAVSAQSIKVGIGFSAGMDVPIGQEDQKSGSIFGFKARLKLLPAIAVEPNLYFTKYGQPTPEGIPDYDLPGSKITAYGVDVTLGSRIGGAGVKPYGVLGAGRYSVKRDEADQEISKVGWSAGLGVEIGVTSAVGLDVRGKLVVIPWDGGDSKKSAVLTGGITYYLGN